MKYHNLFKTKPNKNYTVIIMKVIVFAVFAGRAWQHLFWDAPYREFFWDESLLSPLLKSAFGLSWKEYTEGFGSDTVIRTLIKTTGMFYLLCGFFSLFASRSRRWIRTVLILGSVCLMFLSLLQSKDHFFRFTMFFEHASQFLSPLFLVLLIYHNVSQKKFGYLIRGAIAATFACHGLYALGWPFPRPGPWVDMVMSVFPFGQNFAVNFLITAAILDLIVAVFIFVPAFQKPILYYALFWGAVTSWARVVCNFHFDFPLQTLHAWTHEMVLRAPHGGLPLLILYKEFWFKRPCMPSCADIKNNIFSCFKCSKAYNYVLNAPMKNGQGDKIN